MKIRPLILAAIVVASSYSANLFGQDKPSPSANLALTPPMGWNSWNKFACNVSEDLIHVRQH
jgi:alpha-galactosidase